MNDKILSIAIPTRNQPQELKTTLESIIPQISPEIEIVIGDNSADLETKALIKKEFGIATIRYFNNGGDLGLDRNILSITEKAKGKYIWLFGDDEMEPGAITHVLDIIKKNPEVALIWMNFKTPDSERPARNLGRDQFFKDKNQALKEISNALGFMSSIIFKKDKISNIDEENINQFIGSRFICFYLVMYILSQEEKFYYVDYPYVISHLTPAGKHSYDGFQVFGVDYYRIVKNFQDKFDKKSIKKMLAKNFGYVWRGILVGWMRGFETPKGKFKTMLKLYWSFPEFWLAAPFFLMPKFMTQFVYFIYKKVFRLKHE